MKQILSTLATFGFATALFAADEAGFKSLFNGKDLTGWEGRTNHWSVEDGAITGRTTKENPAKGNNFLIWRPNGTNGIVEDFELRLSYKILGNNTKNFGDSGIQYRSKELPDFVVAGYQANLMVTKPLSGILYEEKGRGIIHQLGQKVVIKTNPDDPKKHKIEVVGEFGKSQEIQTTFKPEDWNDYIVIAKGNHLQHFVNGIQTADVIDEDEARAAKKGILAFQIHAGDPMTVQFKNIRLKQLGKNSASADSLQKLTGKWVPVEATLNGESVGRETLDTVLLTIDGENYTSRRGERLEEGTIAIDASKTPATLDMSRKRSNGEIRTTPAIYEFQGEKLRVCYAYGENTTRPAAFKSEPDSSTVLVTYSRD